MKEALGLVEVSGLSNAILIADVMVKTADVTIVDVEKVDGGGWMMIKVVGDVAAVNASVSAAKQLGVELKHLVASKVIPRPTSYVQKTFCKRTKLAGRLVKDAKKPNAKPLAAKSTAPAVVETVPEKVHTEPVKDESKAKVLPMAEKPIVKPAEETKAPVTEKATSMPSSSVLTTEKKAPIVTEKPPVTPPAPAAKPAEEKKPTTETKTFPAPTAKTPGVSANEPKTTHKTPSPSKKDKNPQADKGKDDSGKK